MFMLHLDYGVTVFAYMECVRFDYRGIWIEWHEHTHCETLMGEIWGEEEISPTLSIWLIIKESEQYECSQDTDDSHKKK